MGYKLSIAIPTWNRLSCLKENIGVIIKQVESFPDGVIELVISDNASDDGTTKYLRELQTLYSFIHVHFCSKNFGANTNFYNVLKNSKGDYIWLLGDDDMIVEGAISKILTDLNKYLPDVIVGGASNDKTLQRVYLKDVIDYQLTNKAIFNKYNPIELVGKMSVLIFSRVRLFEVLDDGMKLINELVSPWPHLIWFLKIMAKGHILLILPYSTNYIVEKHRFNNLQDAKERLALLFVDYSNVLKLLSTEFDDSTLNALKNRIVKGRIAELIKNIAYASFLNGYYETLFDSFKHFGAFFTLKNKFKYFLFYVLPLFLPVSFRLWLFKLPLKLKLNIPFYRDFINNLEEVKKLIKICDDRSIFNRSNL